MLYKPEFDKSRHIYKFGDNQAELAASSQHSTFKTKNRKIQSFSSQVPMCSSILIYNGNQSVTMYITSRQIGNNFRQIYYLFFVQLQAICDKC